MLPQSLTDFLKNVSRFSIKCALQFYNRNGLLRAASLAYTSLLAMTPLSIIMVNIISFFPIFNRFVTEIEIFIFANFVPHTGNIILEALEQFQDKAHHLSWLSFIFLFVTAMMVLTTMESHLNELWEIRKRRFFGLSLLIHWLILTIGPLLLCTSLLLSSYLFARHWFDNILFNHLELFLPFLCSFLAYTFLYLTIPNCKVKIGHAMTGAFIAAILFEAAKIGFIIYTRIVHTYSVLYGALAVIPLFLIWLYVASAIFLIGGQITNLLRTTAAERPFPAPEHK